MSDINGAPEQEVEFMGAESEDLNVPKVKKI